MNKMCFNEMKIISCMSTIFLLLCLMITCNDYLIHETYSNDKEKILSLNYEEINEFYDRLEDIKSSSSEVNYVYPDKLRIENCGIVDSIEIYNGSRFVFYDKKTKTMNSGILKNQKKPKALEKSEKLGKIIKTGKFEPLGYEEKDNRKLRVITVANDENNNSYIKYWILEYNGTNLPYSEEYFSNNKVISKTSYIYQKINDKIDNSKFEFP